MAAWGICARPAWNKRLQILPDPPLPKEGTPLGTTHVLPRTHTISGRTNFFKSFCGGVKRRRVRIDHGSYPPGLPVFSDGRASPIGKGGLRGICARPAWKQRLQILPDPPLPKEGSRSTQTVQRTSPAATAGPSVRQSSRPRPPGTRRRRSYAGRNRPRRP